jgi:hypothetical protein
MTTNLITKVGAVGNEAVYTTDSSGNITGLVDPKTGNNILNFDPTSGDLIANIIPRTGTVSDLQSTAGGLNEISIATNAPFILKHNNTATATSGPIAIPFRERIKSYLSEPTTAGIVVDADIIQVGWDWVGDELIQAPVNNRVSTFNGVNATASARTLDNNYNTAYVIDQSANLYKITFAGGTWASSFIEKIASGNPASTLSLSRESFTTFGKATLLGYGANPFGIGDLAFGNLGDDASRAAITINTSVLRRTFSSTTSAKLTTDGLAPSAENGLFFNNSPNSLFELDYTILIFNPSFNGRYFVRRTTASGIYQVNAAANNFVQILAPTTSDNTAGLGAIGVVITIVAGEFIVTVTPTATDPNISAVAIVNTKMIVV